jgi:hypothetical protein
MSNYHRQLGSVPSSLSSGFMLLIFSGAVATIIFDIWGQVISPGLLGWAKLAPVPLATQTVKVLTGIRSPEAGHFLHLFLVGLVGYPLGWVYIFRPLQERIMPSLPWLVSSAIYGFGLFIVAIGIIAGPLLAGNPWFLNWTPITYVALIGHTIYGIACAAAVNYLERRGLG